MADFHPIDDRWFSEMEENFLADRRAEMVEMYGEDAIESVMQMTALFADLIHIGTDNIPLIKAGLHRMAELVNDMLPRLNGPTGMTRGYSAVDLDGTMGDIPEAVQEVFLGVVGDVLLHSKGGPFETATLIGESVDRLATLMRSGGQSL
jgi:hypothetical protein